MSNFIKSYQANVGLNHTPAYQVSGQPFASGNIDATDAVSVQFPYVTRWVQVFNHGLADVKVGFSEAGVSGSNYFRVPAPATTDNAQSARLELKVSELWLYGTNGVDVVAGLTSIPASRTTTTDGPSWSGSAGVG